VPDSQRIVICGAGVVGAAVAQALTVRGARPTIVERARPGAAASGRAGGFLALDWNDATPVGLLARAGFELHRELAATLGRDIGYRPVETLMVAALDVGSVDANRALPSPDWLDGNVAVNSVIGTAATTAQVDPQRLTDALVDAAVARGAVLVTGVVDGLTPSGGDAQWIVSVDGHPVPADVVVLTLGPWTTRAAAWVPLPAVHALKGASITLAADVPAQAVFSEHIGRDGRRSAPEIYPRPGGVVYVNGYPENAPLPDDPDAIAPSARACDELHRVAGVHSSALRDAQVLTRRACYRPVTADGVPIIGPVPGSPGVFVATGHGPWGILNAPSTGRMVAEMILAGASRSLDAEPFLPSRLPAAIA
jgi:glycine/D-amino acid oxidase-like deaminating enzyme